jgi:outer membrane protein insertion porin family/translocation and assembly module TamA
MPRAAAGAAFLTAALLSALAVAASPVVAQERPADIACDSEDDLEVRVLRFIGNKAHSSYNLERGIATTASTWWRRTFRVFGKKYCLDSLHALVIDSARLDFHYRRTGFPDVRIQPAIRPLGGRKVAVEYRITEGQPMLMDSVTVVWDQPIPDTALFTDDLPIKAGDRFDNLVLEATRDTIQTRLTNRGYPQAKVLRNFDQYPAEHRATVQYEILPGPKSWIGRIEIPPPQPAVQGRPSRVSTDRVREVLGVHEGDLYNESALQRAGRGLFATEAFRFVGVDTIPDPNPTDSLIDVRVTLNEAELLATRASIGWANLDCLRTQVNYTNFNFLGLRRLDFNGRLSKIGTSAPTEWAEGLCTRELLSDEVSDTLNYYAGMSLSQAALFGLHIVPTISVYSELRSEFKAYLRETPIGVIASAQQGIFGRLPMTWSYQLEYGRTAAQPAFFCAVFNVCEADARERLERYTRSAVVGWAAIRSRVNSLTNPTSGNVMRLDLRHASPVVGSNKDASFNRATFDATVYTEGLGGLLVARLRAGTVLGSRLDLTGETTPTFIPLQERLYAGGPNSVRGFRQNEMGPAIYIPNDFTDTLLVDDTLQIWRANPLKIGDRTVPTGGDNVIVANIELRRRAPAYPELAQYALFVDAGQVWNRGRAGTGVNFADIRVTPGVGLRLFTPVGPVRVDVGYNAYRRPAGPAYITDLSGNLICVSPGNTLRVRVVEGQSPRQIDEGDCPATYTPKRGDSFWQRLTFQFSIGQPF